MRITAAAKQATRQRILQVARTLFSSQGFDATTTRDISHQSKVAAGTLFNYFPSKEAIVSTLAADGLSRGRRDFERKRRTGAGLEEDLFLHVACGLRRLGPLRKSLRPALETAFHPLAETAADSHAESLRVGHLETVERLLAEHGLADPAAPLDMQLYWTLYTGVLTVWVGDRSPHQEDTLALLDQSLRMFVGWLRSRDWHDGETERSDGVME